MPAYSSAPWTAERMARGFVHVMSQADRDGIRQIVALVDGGDAVDANTALICAAPVMAAAIMADDLPAARAALFAAGLAS